MDDALNSITAKFQNLPSLTKLLRFLELSLAVVLLTWISSRLPFAVRIFGEYFRRLSAVILSPIFVFLLGNCIVLTLISKSGVLSSKTSGVVNNAVAELYEELQSDDFPVPEDIIFQDKQIIVEENDVVSEASIEKEEEEEEEVVKVRRRSKSETLEREIEEKPEDEKLRRSETEVHRESVVGDGEVLPEEGEDMSQEEFRRTIEAFIARQVRFHREERLAVVLHGQA